MAGQRRASLAATPLPVVAGVATRHRGEGAVAATRPHVVEEGAAVAVTRPRVVAEVAAATVVVEVVAVATVAAGAAGTTDSRQSQSSLSTHGAVALAPRLKAHRDCPFFSC